MIRLTRHDTAASNRGGMGAALQLGISLAVALPGPALEAAGAGSEAQPRALGPPAVTPPQTGPFLPNAHIEILDTGH